MAQRLADGRWIRVLTMVDQFIRECLALYAATQSIAAHNGTEFASKASTTELTSTECIWISSGQAGRAAEENTAIKPPWNTLSVSHFPPHGWGCT